MPTRVSVLWDKNTCSPSTPGRNHPLPPAPRSLALFHKQKNISKGNVDTSNRYYATSTSRLDRAYQYSPAVFNCDVHRRRVVALKRLGKTLASPPISAMEEKQEPRRNQDSVVGATTARTRQNIKHTPINPDAFPCCISCLTKAQWTQDTKRSSSKTVEALTFPCA